MADPQPASGPRRRVWLIVAVAVAAVVIIVAIVIGVSARRQATVVAPAPTSATGSAGNGASSSATSPSAAPSTPGTASTEPTAATTSSEPGPTATSSTSAKAGNQQTKSPVPLDDDEEVKPGLTAGVDKIEAVTGKAEGPGEVGGPAIRFTVKLVNTGDQPQPLTTTVVNVYYGDKATPASTLSGPGVTPMPESVAPGAEASATYVFAVPRSGRDKVVITVDYSVDTSVVAFRGRAPR